MTNLLPQEQQKLLQKEYHIRRAIITMGFVNALFLIAVILLIPSYALVAYRAEATIPPLNSNEQAKRALLTTEVTNDNILLTALTPTSTALVSAGISLIMSDAPSGDSVTSIDYEPGSAGPFTITVGGTASSRESLLAFIDALKQEPSIASVDLPISNFTSDSDIKFSFVVTGKKI